jgi:hypothetical protein
MQNNLFRKGLTIIVLALFILINIISSITIPALKQDFSDNDRTFPTDEGTEYWALLIGVGVYGDSIDEHRPSMLSEVDDLYDVLLESSSWSADHIKVIKGEDATVPNIIRGLRWLDKKDDRDDISLVYISTHGAPLSSDIPPVDEDDGVDEALMSYWGFTFPVPPFSFIWDDELNFMLNRLDSKGVCLILNTCYAGGFDDSSRIKASNYLFPYFEIPISPLKWMEGFAEDVSAKGRVVIMSSQEYEVTIAGRFSPFLIDGLRGFADKNMDGIVTAEEAFFYIEPRCFWHHPKIYDGYTDELPLIDLASNENKVPNKIEKNDYNKLESKWMQLEEVNFDGDAIVCGYITDSATNYPIEDTFVEMEWQSDALNWDHDWMRSNSFGFFSFNVLEGYVTLRFLEDNYFSKSTGWFTVKENDKLWVNVSLDTLPPENAVVCGYITDYETSEPLKDISVYLERLDYEGRRYRNHCEVNQIGFYSINTVPGEIYLEPYPEYDYPWEMTCRYDVLENETIWVNLSLHRCIDVDILKPLKAIYVKNKLLVPFTRTVIFGDVDIEAFVHGYYWMDPLDVDKVELYIDDELKHTYNSTPCKWKWDEKSMLKHKHTITLIAYEGSEVVSEKEIQVWKFF